MVPAALLGALLLVNAAVSPPPAGAQAPRPVISQTEVADNLTLAEVAPSTDRAQAQPTSHRVSSGETVSLIAEKFGLTVDLLIRLNPGLEVNVDQIFPGEVLSLAEGAASKLQPRTKPVLAAAAPNITQKPNSPLPVRASSTARSGTFRVTGYACPPFCGLTASGVQVGLGQVAVDPRVIPLGSTVVVEGLGQYVATDTGGDIKGNWIDIFVGGDIARAYQITGYYQVSWY